MQSEGSWEKITVTVDSGAVDSVVPEQVGRAAGIRQTEASRRGMKYRAANGTVISNKGERDLKGYSREGNTLAMTMQVAGVTKPLGSVRSMVEANNMVVFDKGNSFIVNKGSGIKTRIDERGGAYVFDMWVPKASDSSWDNIGHKNLFKVIEEEDNSEEQDNMDFVGRDDLF